MVLKHHVLHLVKIFVKNKSFIAIKISSKTILPEKTVSCAEASSLYIENFIKIPLIINQKSCYLLESILKKVSIQICNLCWNQSQIIKISVCQNHDLRGCVFATLGEGGIRQFTTGETLCNSKRAKITLGKINSVHWIERNILIIFLKIQKKKTNWKFYY